MSVLDGRKVSKAARHGLTRLSCGAHVPEPSVDETYEILLGLRERYEAHHKLRYTDEALSAAAKFSSQYISDRFLPDKVRLCRRSGFRLVGLARNVIWQIFLSGEFWIGRVCDEICRSADTEMMQLLQLLFITAGPMTCCFSWSA